MTDLREKTALLIEKEGQRAKVKFKAVILTEWIKENPGKNDPRESGAMIRTINFPGKGKQECILFRKGRESECDVDLETSLFAANQEESQGTQNQIRSGQAKAIHRQAAKHAVEIASSSNQTDCYRRSVAIGW